MKDRALAATLLAVMLVGLALQIEPVAALSWIARGLAVLVILLALATGRLGLREGYLIGLSALLSGLAFWLHPDRAAAVMAGAMDQAAYLMCFILALGLLHEGAATSPAVADSGLYLTRQPPSRRYSALFTGSGAMSVMFNLGTVSFLVPLVQRGIAQGVDDGLNPIRERRQISAILRGFAWAVIWSPTAIAPLVVARLIPGTDRGRWFIIGICVFALILALGAAEDAWRFRGYRGRAQRPVRPPVPWRAFGRFALACLWLFGAALTISALTGRDVIPGLLVACPVMLLGWQAVQVGWPTRPGAAAEFMARMDRIHARLPGAAGVAVTLAGSGFVGKVAADLVPAAELGRLLGIEALPDFVLLSLIPVVLSAMSLLALSPIMTAVFFGGLFGALPVLPADPTLIAFAISCGWGLSMTLAPVSTPVLLINRVAGLAPRMVSFGWNGWFCAICAAAMWPIFWLLTGGQ